MRGGDRIAAAAAVLLLAAQVGVGGLWPFGRALEEERLDARSREIEALAAAREAARAESDRMRAYLREEASPFPPDAAGSPIRSFPPESGRLDWGPGPEAGTYRMEARASFDRILDLLGELDASPGSLRVERLELVPEGSAVRASLLLRDTMGGD